MYWRSAAVVPRAIKPVGTAGSQAFMPVHQGSQAHAPGLTHAESASRLGVDRFAIKSDATRSAGCRPIISTRQGLTRGVAETTSPLPSQRPASVTAMFAEPVPVMDMPALIAHDVMNHDEILHWLKGRRKLS